MRHILPDFVAPLSAAHGHEQGSKEISPHLQLVPASQYISEALPIVPSVPGSWFLTMAREMVCIEAGAHYPELAFPG
jgi:hypothetical protein